MADCQRQLLFLRFAEIEAELEALTEGRVVGGDAASVEADLLQEQDETEYPWICSNSTCRSITHSIL